MQLCKTIYKTILSTKATLFPNFLPYGCFAYNYFSISCNSFLKIQKKALFFSEKLR